MPSYRGITCSVKTDNGLLKEWGVRHLRNSTSTQCFIQADTGARFRLHLTPDIPFDYAHWRDCDVPSDSEASSSRGRSGSAASSNHSGSDSMAGIRRLRSDSDTLPPFHLLVTVYLDGRKKPERRSIVYLDPGHEQFDSKMNGTISLKTTWMEGRDGQIHEYSWMFGEVGLDRFLTDLSIKRGKKNANDNDDAAAPVNDETELLNAFGNASLERDDAEEQKQVGKIVVTLARISVGERWQASNYRARRKEGEQEDVDMTGVKEVSHTTE